MSTGCPELKKQLFLRDLMDLMQTKMKESNTDSDETTAKWQASKEERIATWHFVMLDKNKNKVGDLTITMFDEKQLYLYYLQKYIYRIV